MSSRRIASLVTRARVSSVSSGLETLFLPSSSSSSIRFAFSSSTALPSQVRKSTSFPSIIERIHGSGCGCARCCRVVDPSSPRCVSGSTGAAKATEALAEQEVDVSFIHPTEQQKSQNQNYTEGGGSYWLMQPVYDAEYLELVKPRPRKPESFMDWTGFSAVWVMRRAFDLITGYGPNMTHQKWMTRFLFLESVAGVPGMVGAMHRHLRSLRDMRRDGGRIHTLLEESENERMHLLTFLQLKQPSMLFRFNVIATQGVFLALYSLFYAISERHCAFLTTPLQKHRAAVSAQSDSYLLPIRLATGHAFVEFLETEAVKTYTHAISDYDNGRIPEWKGLAAPAIAKKYWRLKEDATFRDLLLNVRADEACHQHVNGAFATMGIWDPNPFAPGTTQHLATEP